ncbi:uncharacterized protein LOC120264797 [Dioscorea cayenensis subsp. rotundata]|uniref:Uncharacterized protein LOC120264797 n=1 Tax=Dioscorea cayennensis subsp. rotundata TaxID=55577 RepID=A0AB40BME0_DIOCR|nr:uncharacterized protein LOC120264797 [Dioscorea cayenensis subsp. rotundata]
MDSATCEPNRKSGDICGGSSGQGLSCRDSLVAQKCCNASNKEAGMCIATAEDLNVRFCNDEVAALIVQEIGNNFQGMLHICDSSQQLSGNDASLDDDKMDMSIKIRMLQEMNNSVSLDAKVERSLNKFPTFPCPKELQNCSAPMNCRKGLLSRLLDGPTSSKSENPAYARSLSLPPSSSLVSAMKGGREENGICLEMKLHVKWAPEVYDPPSTTMSHTVKSHQHRPKARRKDQQKHKHKGKSSRNKHTNKTNGGNKASTSYTRPRGDNEELLFDGCYSSEFTLPSQEAKCGSNFLGNSLTKVQLSTAEV